MKRACKLIEKDTGKRIKLLSLKLNSGYILFSAAMLFLSEAAIAWLNVNTAATMGFLLSATLTAAFYIWILRISFKRRWIGITAKIFAVVMIALSALMMSLHVHAVSTLFILAMIWSIFVYSSLFAKRNGLIKTISKKPSCSGRNWPPTRRPSSSDGNSNSSRPTSMRWTPATDIRRRKKLPTTTGWI